MTLNRAMAARRPSDYRTLASLSRINLLHELLQHDAQTVTELVEATGLHHNTAREHLHRLIDAGFVESEPVPTSTKGRPKLRYRATQGPNSPARQSRLRAAEQRTTLIRKFLPVEDITAERTPAARQLDSLDDHMDQCGFTVEIAVDYLHMTMHDCPFSELAKNNPQVCDVHLALLKNALDDADGPLRVRELHPFSGPHTCTVDMENPPASEH